MITTLHGGHLTEHSQLFEELLRLRYHVFVNQRRWSLPTRQGLDSDQYDGPSAVYFADLNPSGVIEAHLRLTPTLTGSLLADYFPHLIEGGLSPRGEHIYEATRYIVLPARKSRENNRATKARLLTAMLEWASANGVSHIQTVIDTATFASFVEMTPETIPLGLSHPYGGGPSAPGGGDCMAIRWPVTPKVLADVSAYGSLTHGLAEGDKSCGSKAA